MLHDHKAKCSTGHSCHKGYNGVSIPSFLIRYRGSCPLYSHDTGDSYSVFPHRIQGFLSPFLTGYNDYLPILPDWVQEFLSYS